MKYKIAISLLVVIIASFISASICMIQFFYFVDLSPIYIIVSVISVLIIIICSIVVKWIIDLKILNINN